MYNISSVVENCRERIDSFEERCRYALNVIDRERCPLSMASPRLYDEINYIIDEWCEDNDIDFDDIDFDAEDVLFYSD